MGFPWPMLRRTSDWLASNAAATQGALKTETCLRMAWRVRSTYSRHHLASPSGVWIDHGLDYVVLDAMRHDPVNQIVEAHHVLISESATCLFPVRIRYC